MRKILRIAILGWGSLIWDPRTLPINGNWQTGGPVLPIEFSRISQDRRLTLVIDSANGAPVETRYTQSVRTSISEAVSDLCEREGTVTRLIGFVDLPNETHRCETCPTIIQSVRAWAHENGFDGVIWTDLPSNFEEKTGEPFSVVRAEACLRQLPATEADRARAYIVNAPAEVQTPLRRRLLESGWLALNSR